MVEVLTDEDLVDAYKLPLPSLRCLSLILETTMAFLHPTVLLALDFEDEEQTQPEIHPTITDSLCDTPTQTFVDTPAFFRWFEYQVTMVDATAPASNNQSTSTNTTHPASSADTAPTEASTPLPRQRKAVSFASNATKYTYCPNSKITPNPSTAMPPLDISAPRVSFQTRTNPTKDKVASYYHKIAMKTNGQLCRCVVEFLAEERREGRSWAKSLWVGEASRRANSKGKEKRGVKAKGERGNGQFARWEDDSDEEEQEDDSDGGQDDEANSDDDEPKSDDDDESSSSSSSSDSDSDSDSGEPTDGPRLNHTLFSDHLATVLSQLSTQINCLKSRYPAYNTRNRAFHKRCDLILSCAEETVNRQPQKNKLMETNMASCGTLAWIWQVERTVKGFVERLEKYETALAVEVGRDAR